MNKFLILFLLIFYPALLFSQAEKKRISAVPTMNAPKIDGVMDEEIWQTVPAATDFHQRIPFNGKSAIYPSEIRFIYDQTGLYVGAKMTDPYPDSIPSQLGLRDSPSLNADNFVLILSPFNDGINAFCFMVYVSDVQADFKIPGSFEDGNEDEDFTWDAVWQSKSKKNEKGWIVEMKIPYSAIRFPRKPVQEWGLNCQRSIRRYREIDTWNLVDSKISGYVNQCGLLQGIENIKPPLRLSLTPYVSGYLQNSPGENSYQLSYNYGADLKYGINQSFTLDMTMIPDFGQVQSDDKYYNFSPFEIKYDEKRQFFTEGTELFNKGGIFYSRRIGTTPKGYSQVYNEPGSNETVTENPGQTKLINATKISGRTSKGLGIGIFNAMSANTWATITDTITGDSRRVLTQGFTNYNMLVFDQNLKNNSYIDFLNTNYCMPTEGYTANVTGTTFKFANKKYTYALTGDGFISQKYYVQKNPDLGYRYSLGFGKISGNFLFSYNQLLETKLYDPNDMGFNAMNNRFNNSLSFQYNIYEPFWKVVNWFNLGRIDYNCLYDGFKFTSFQVYLESNTTTTKYLSIGSNLTLLPFESHDYFEPRVDGWVYIAPAQARMTMWFSSDYRKKFALDWYYSGILASQYKTSGYEAGIEPRYRISDRMFLQYHLYYDRTLNDVGYVMDSIDAAGAAVILFGRRDIQNITNILEFNYMITSSMSIDLRARHYWVSAPYYAFFQLLPDGKLNPVTYQGDQDVNYNLFNIDLTYIWNFAPGSQLSLMWKNAINTLDKNIIGSLFRDFGNTISSPASNSFSVRILYYLDALYFKKKKKAPSD